eukprot:2095823-Rhodomonas_salina.2
MVVPEHLAEAPAAACLRRMPPTLLRPMPPTLLRHMPYAICRPVLPQKAYDATSSLGMSGTERGYIATRTPRSSRRSRFS